MESEVGKDIVSYSFLLGQYEYAPEAVLEPPGDRLEVAHAAGTSRLAALGLLAPLERADLGRGVAARGASWTGRQQGDSRSMHEECFLVGRDRKRVAPG